MNINQTSPLTCLKPYDDSLSLKKKIQRRNFDPEIHGFISGGLVYGSLKLYAKCRSVVYTCMPFLGDGPYFSSDFQRGHASQELQPPFGRQGGSHPTEPTTQQPQVPSRTQAVLH